MADRNVLINENTMTNIAEAIRTKTGKSNKILPADMPSEIVSIPTNNSGDFLLQDVRINPSKYEKTVYPDGGYYGFSSATVNAVTSAIDSNIKSENIKSGVTILDVQGSYTGTGGIDTSDATATASDILNQKTAYVNGSKVTGTMPNNGAVNGTINGLTTDSYTIPRGYTSGGTVSLTDDIENALSEIIDESGVSNQIEGIADEVDTQTTLINQILSNLDGKGVGGGGSSIPSTIRAGDTPVLSSSALAYTCTSTNMTASGISITVPRSGTYRFKFASARTNTSGTWNAQLYKNGSAVSGATITWNQYQGTCSADISCNANDKIEIYVSSRGSSYRQIVSQLIACIDWDTGF